MAASTRSSLDPEFAKALKLLLQYANADGLRPVVTETVRSTKEQNRRYAQGRTSPGPIVTNAKGGQSPHQYGLAADVTSSYGYGTRQALAIRELARQMGFGLISWDEPHVEWPDWRRRARI